MCPPCPFSVAARQECLEGLCTDPLAPLDFGYDLGRINAAPELETFDSCVECGTLLTSCTCGAAEARAAADHGSGAALASTLSTRSDCSTASRPGISSQQLPMDAAAAAAAGMFGAAVAAAAAAAGVDPALFRQYRAAGDRQGLLVEERLQAAAAAAAAAAAQRKRAAEGAPEGALPPPAARGRGVETGEAAPAPFSRRWAGASGVGAVVTTGIAGRTSALIQTMSSLTPATPTADAALAPTMGSFIWQHPAQALGSGSMALSSGPAPGAGQRPAGAVTTGVAEAAAALQRHAAAAATAKPAEPGVTLTVHAAPAAAAAAGASPRAHSAAAMASWQAPPASAAAASDKPPASAAGQMPAPPPPTAGSNGGGAARAASRTPRAPARRTSRAASSSGGEGGGRQLPIIPQYREGETRADKLARYRAKRERRRFQKTVRYECRKVGETLLTWFCSMATQLAPAVDPPAAARTLRHSRRAAIVAACVVRLGGRCRACSDASLPCNWAVDCALVSSMVACLACLDALFSAAACPSWYHYLCGVPFASGCPPDPAQPRPLPSCSTMPTCAPASRAGLSLPKSLLPGRPASTGRLAAPLLARARQPHWRLAPWWHAEHAGASSRASVHPHQAAAQRVLREQ